MPKRFDLGAHFAAVGGRAWQWTAQTRAAVMAAQGGAHTESVLISRPRVDPVTCDEIVSRLIGNAGWLTVRVADDTATAMLPHCLGVRAPRGIPAASAASSVPSQPLVSRAFPDAPSLRRLLAFFEKRLRANGHHSAARDVAEAAGGADGALGGTLRRAVPGTLWNSPIVIPRPSPLLRAFSRAKPTAGGELAPRQGARVAQMIRRVHGRLLNASRRELQGMSAIPMTRSSAVSASTQSFTVQSMPGTGVEAIPGEAEVPTIGLLTSCTLHAMLRPRKALARYFHRCSSASVTRHSLLFKSAAAGPTTPSTLGRPWLACCLDLLNSSPTFLNARGFIIFISSSKPSTERRLKRKLGSAPIDSEEGERRIVAAAATEVETVAVGAAATAVFQRPH